MAQAEMPGARVATIAARHAVSATQIYAWCREGRAARAAAAANALVPVVIDDAPSGARGEIEIALSGGVRIVVRGAVEAAALRTVVAVLRG